MNDPRVATRIAAIERAWHQAKGLAVHGPNCSCCGGQPIVLQADGLAEGIEHALIVRFRATADLRYLRLLEACRLDPGEDLIVWLRRLATIESEVVMPVFVLVEDMLASIAQGSATRR